MIKYKITQVDPKFENDEISSVVETLRSGWITEGKKSEQFVAQLNKITGSPFGVLAPNGTLALALGLLGLGLGPGDEVLVPDVTFMGSASAVLLIGARPVCVDVDSEYFLFNPDKAKRKITYRTKAIMPVHLFGVACNMDVLEWFCKRYRLLMIEDAAQGIGVRWNGKHVGGFGDVGCFSFFADKTITTGEGGYVCCKDKTIYERLLLLRNQGRHNRGSFIHPAIGYNFRMTDLQSALGCEQLKKLDLIISQKRELTQLYFEGLKNLGGVRILGAPPGSNQVAFRCVILGPRIKDLALHLENKGIQTRSVFYPLHRQPCILDWKTNHSFQKWLPKKIQEAFRQNESNSYKSANFFWDNGLCLPMHMKLTREDVESICESVREFYS